MNIANNICICYTMPRQNDVISPYGQHKNPTRCELVGFSIPFWQGGLVPRLVAVIVSVQPFANEVGDYTCQNRENK